MKYTKEDLAEIFKQYHNRIYGLALKMSRNTEDAKDILQNTFIKAIRNLSQFRNESAISTWLYRIAINEANMKWRKEKSQAKLLKWGKEEYRDMPPLSADGQLVQQEDKEIVDTAIKKLPLKYRALVLLKDFHDLEYAQISRILKISVPTVKTRLHRGREYLRRAILKYNEGKNFPPFSPKILPALNEHTCSLATKFLDGFISGTTPVQKKTKFQKHIADCSPCKKFLKDYQQAIAITKSLQCEDIPPQLLEKITNL